jgi:hypothetical protein
LLLLSMTAAADSGLLQTPEQELAELHPLAWAGRHRVFPLGSLVSLSG